CAAREEEKQLYKALGKLWTVGAAVDWQAFSANRKQTRVPLPTYPFERQKFWVSADSDRAFGSIGANGSAGNHNSRGAAVKQMDVGKWFYLPSWKRTLPRHTRIRAGELTKPQSRWLIFSDKRGIGAALIGML